ncbi:MAG: FUSC family protein [Lapillicoccus sp.]
MTGSASRRSRELLVAGRGRGAVELRDARDRVIASDPGLTRLRQGLSAILAVATTIAVEAGFAAVAGVPSATGLLALLLGAVIAMPLSTSVRESDRRVALVTIAGGGAAAALGAVVGVLTAQVHLLGLVTFTVVSFIAVWVRRFGPRWFTLGFLGWQAFFFSLFLDPPVVALPFMVAAIVVATAWVGLLLVTVLHVDPGPALERTVVALRARARAALSAAIGVLDTTDDLGAVRAMRGQLIQLSEVSLLLDGQLSTVGSLPPGLRAGFVRRWVVDVEIGMDEICAAVLDLAAHEDEVPREVLDDVRSLLGVLGWASTATALVAAKRLQRTAHQGVPAARRLGAAAVLLLETIDEWDHPALRPDPADEVLDDADEAVFEPVVTLFSGNLPGSALLAAQTLDGTDARWWSPSRLRLTTRQAIQAAVAAGLSIIIGEAISPQRYYWAVIASFIAFTGTATSGETIRKSVSRIAGTVAGLVVAVALANLTSASTAVTLVTLGLCIFLAFYLQAVSYTAMTFFITLMLGELYTLLHTFSDQLLVVRLEETAVGALVGVGVCLMVLPASSRGTLRVARRAFLASLAALLDACGDHLGESRPEEKEEEDEEREPRADLITLVVQTSADARQVVRMHRALTRGRVFGSEREGLQHRISLLGSADSMARTLAARVEATTPGSSPDLAAACREIAAEARHLAELPTLITAAPRTVDSRVGERVGVILDGVANDPATDRVRIAVRRLADSLSLLTPRST